MNIFTQQTLLAITCQVILFSFRAARFSTSLGYHALIHAAAEGREAGTVARFQRCHDARCGGGPILDLDVQGSLPGQLQLLAFIVLLFCNSLMFHENVFLTSEDHQDQQDFTTPHLDFLQDGVFWM